MDTPIDMQRIRAAIEAVDREILANLRQRMDLAAEIAAAKLESAAPFRDQLREQQVLDRVRRLAADVGLDPHSVEKLYRDIMEMSIARQQDHVRSRTTVPLRVAYQGVEGSNSHLAAQRRYAGRQGGVLLTGHVTFGDATAAVRSGSADLALLPIENTTAGSINETYDLLSEDGLTITAEVISRIEHCLLALPGTKLEELRSVMSHPQGLLQCEDFLRQHPWLKPVAEFDTAGAARKVKEGHDKTTAAIASESAATVYGLEILARGIQTQAGNYTRFVEVAREAVPCPADAPCKTSIVLRLGHQPGALGQVLHAFGVRQVNLTKIESRPILGRAWEYRFYLDVEGHVHSAPVAAALDDVRNHVSELRVLGTYPQDRDTPGHP